MEKQNNNLNDNLIYSDIKLTIGMLVSNHIQYIRKAMEALKPLLEAVPSELVVVDTKGSETDGSIDVVREYTDKIYPFTWCDDFSMARNVCLEHARGEWFLYVDDDEWFDDVTEFIEFFNSGECENYNAGNYYTRDYHSKGGYSFGVAGRMIRRRENTRFEGKVHETFNEVHNPVKQFSCFTHHYGYVYQTKEAAKKKQQRNVSILKKELLLHGTVPRLCAQMVQELIGLPDTRKAGYAFAIDSLRRFEASGEEFLTVASAQWIMLSTIRYFGYTADFEGAKKQLTLLESKYNMNKITYLCIAGFMANLAAECKKTEDTIHYCREYLEYWDWKCQQDESEIISLVNLDMPWFYNEEYHSNILYIGAASCNRIKQFDEAEKFWNRMPWRGTGVPKKRYEKEYQVTLKGLKKKETVPQLIKSDIKLTIGMLVSNHIQYIRNSMEALKPLLEAVPSELIIIDTKGAETDGSIDIVREYTDKIYPFTWCNDFSAARNVCLEHARGEWFLYVDDDEWFDDVQEFIDFFQGEECEKYQYGYYYTRDYLPNGTYSKALAGRMIRRRTNTRFVGRIHETFNEGYLPEKYFSCFTHHYGYAYSNEEEKQAKRKRNLDILREEIRDNGLTVRNATQMVQELLQGKDTAEEGYHFAMDCIAKLNKIGQLGSVGGQWILTASVRYFSIVDAPYKKLLEQTELIQTYSLTKIAEMVLAALIVKTAIEEQDYTKVIEYAELYLKNWDWSQNHKQEAMQQMALDFPLFCTSDYYQDIIHNAAIAANQLQKYDLANQYWKRMPWQEEGFDSFPYAWDLNVTICGMKEAKKKQFAVKAAELAPLVEILQEAGTQLKFHYSEGNMAVAKQYLAAMQEAAISLATSLGNLIGQNSLTVKLLEQYCELLRNCSNTESQEEASELAGILCEAAGLIQDSFAKEII